MKIGILTFHASHNYGSMLQAYALQTELLNQGHEVYIINLRIWAQKAMYSHPLLTFRKRTLLYAVNPRLLLQNISKYGKFEKFMKDYYHLTPELHNLKEVENFIRTGNFDAIISGGDQIWNMNATDFSIAYYLPFDLPGVRKIAYSASFGSGENFVPERYSKAIHSLLENYDSLCTRDEGGSRFLSRLFGKNIPSMTDPTMLLTRDEYLKLAGEKPLIKGRYVFYYSPFNRPEYIPVAKSIAEMKGLPIYTSNGQANQCRGMHRIQNAGPKEFLNMLSHAEVVCGKSFHMLVFALIFEKDFYSICGDTDVRMKGLLEKLGLIDRGISTNMQSVNLHCNAIDWTHVHEILSQYRVKGTNYLNETLK